MTPAELTGQVRSHLVDVTDPARAGGAAGSTGPTTALHMHAAVPFMNLRRAARAAGIALRAVSSFRDFDRQLAIWNAKYQGEKPLYDAAGHELRASDLSPSERVAAILLWSALPGASRHHWGTDVDLIDVAAIPPDYEVQLSIQEFAPAGPFSPAGPFAPLSAWLESEAPRFGFFRPFRGILSGVRPEPWHFSFAPVAEIARRALTCDVLRAALTDAPLSGKAEVLLRLEELHARYVAAIDWP